eukprot:1931901-Amphidinium_carterae.1
MSCRLQRRQRRPKAKKPDHRVRFQADEPASAARDNVTREECLHFTPPTDLSHPVLRREVQAKAEPVTSKYVMATKGEEYDSGVKSVRKEFAGFVTKEALRDATPDERKASKPLPCTMVFCRKPIRESQRQESQLAKPVIEKSRICICGNFQDAFYQDTSTTNADAHLARLMLAVNADKKGRS